MSAETALVFDDDNFFRTLLTDTLTGLNLQVTSYSSHALFLAQLKAGDCPAAAPAPDFILTDNQMPGMTGLEFLSQLRQLGCRIPESRIAIISGRWDEADLATARQLGCQVFQKYNSPEQLSTWIEKVRQDR